MIERGYSKVEIDSAIEKAKQIEIAFITKWDEEELWYKQYYGAIAEELGEKEIMNELFLFAHFAVNCGLFPEVKGILAELSKKYRLAVISNAMPSMDWIFDKLGIRKYFDTIILSAFVKEEKPSEAIYNIALKNTHLQKEDCIFIDDKIENVDGAERVGIKGIHLDRSRQNLLDLLKENQLLFSSDKNWKSENTNSSS